MAKKKDIQVPKTFLEQLDEHFEKKEKVYFWILFGICTLFCILLYDPRVSLAGDDSAYILRALEFGKNFAFPDFQGPLFPMALSPLTLLFGLSLFPLKLFSLASIVAFFYFTYITFRKKIPGSLLFTLLLLTAINSHVLYYASQTFSEAFYMLLQSVVLLVFSRFFLQPENQDIKIVSFIKRHAWLALSVLALALTRSVGFSAIIAVFGYFIFYKEWKNAGAAILSFGLLFVLYQGVKWAIWGDGSLQFSGQSSSLFSKNYYSPESGRENLAGFIIRLWDNSRLYLSEILPSLAGIRDLRENANGPGMLTGYNTLTTLLIYAIAITGLFFSYRRNKLIFFSGIICGCFLLVSFVSLQTFWYQSRLIIPAYPLIILLLFAGLYYLLKEKKGLKNVQFLFVIPIIFMFFGGISDSVKNITEARKIKNEYSGLTPDWIHFAEASEWAGKNLANNDLVASRKPTISMIYSKGKIFHGIYSVPGEDPKKFMEEWQQRPGRFIVLKEPGNEQYNGIRTRLYARIIQEDRMFLLMKKNNETVQLADSLQLPVVDPAEVISIISAQPDRPPLIYSADSLVRQLKEGKVTHILSANLRANPAAKGAGTINTVERYMFIIAEKYPDAFVLVQQFGQDNDEPAYIYKIDWESIGN